MRVLRLQHGSSAWVSPAAETLGELFVERGIELVYGGGNIGLMGVLADKVLAHGGRVTGIIPESLMAREVGHLGLTELRVVGSMHERKAVMSDLSDGFIALPGGFGTIEEFCEVVTWSQLGIQSKPCGLLNVESYFAPLLELFDQAVRERFLREENRRLVLDDRDPEQLLTRRWQRSSLSQCRSGLAGKSDNSSSSCLSPNGVILSGGVLLCTPESKDPYTSFALPRLSSEVRIAKQLNAVEGSAVCRNRRTLPQPTTAGPSARAEALGRDDNFIIGSKD